MAFTVAIGLLLSFGCRKPNNAPETPVVPSCEAVGFPGDSSTFWSKAADADGDSVAIRFVWGDGDTSDWSPYFLEGAWTSMRHSWSSAGTYYVTAQAKDQKGARSGWSGGCGVPVIRGWARTFGGTGDDVGASVQQTQDGGYIITGLTNSQGAALGDVWLIKTDVAGTLLWDKLLGGNSPDWGNSVQQTSDGGYIIAGGTASYGAGDYDAWLVKTDVNGDTVWTRTFGGTGYDEGNSVQQTSDGGYIVTGSTASYGTHGDGVLLVKTDANGDTAWTRVYGGVSIAEGRSVQQTQDGGYVVAGYAMSISPIGAHVWLLKTDANGDTAWTRSFGESGEDEGYSVQQTQDGGYIITGYAFSRTEGDQLWLIKTDANGDTMWTRRFGGGFSIGYSGRQTRDGGYIVTGYTDTEHPTDAWLIRTDANGATLWTRTFGNMGIDGGKSVIETRDGGYIITGLTSSYGAGYDDVWLIRVESDGMISPLTRVK